MTISRRFFVTGAIGAGVTAATRPASAIASALQQQPPSSFDPWLEIDASAIDHNLRTIARLTGNRPILAVAKNNAYGLGLGVAGPLIERSELVSGLAVVRVEEALTLRRAGVRKPLLLMGPASDEESEALARDGVRLAAYLPADAARLMRLARTLGRPVDVHIYVDTGMHRMGFALDQVLPWLETPGLHPALRINGAMSELTEDQDFDRAQAGRLRALADQARAKGMPLGRLHAASSDAIAAPTPETFLDMVRPGLALYGGYASPEAMARAELRPAYRMKARVIRVDRLAAGDGVSYHRRFVAERPMAAATLAIGHVDGYPSGAVKGCEVLIRGQLYPVIGTVSASHTIVGLDAAHPVQVGDEATLVGPERPSLHPNVIAQRSGWSEYNMFMHLHPGLARRVV
jgi:alanine racemase